jgi:hypothetical protein
MLRRKKDPSTPSRKQKRPNGKITLGPLKAISILMKLSSLLFVRWRLGDMAPQIGNYLFYGFGYLHDKLVLETRRFIPKSKFQTKLDSFTTNF